MQGFTLIKPPSEADVENEKKRKKKHIEYVWLTSMFDPHQLIYNFLFLPPTSARLLRRFSEDSG